MEATLVAAYERAERDSESPRGVARLCTKPGCRRPTADAKPFCMAHIAEQPYVQALLAEEKRRRKNATRPSRSRKRGS